MSSFKREENGEISIEISTQESHVLISLTEQLLELLSQGDSLAEAQDPLLHIVGISDSDALPDDQCGGASNEPSKERVGEPCIWRVSTGARAPLSLKKPPFHYRAVKRNGGVGRDRDGHSGKGSAKAPALIHAD